MSRHAFVPLYWVLLATALALASLFIAWKVLAAVDFGYPIWYEALGIDSTIARYAPENRYRDGFEQTTRAERLRLFAAIADAVRHDGAGLQALRYRAPDGRVLGRLLRPPETEHLRDVSRLVAAFQWIGWAGVGMLALLIGVGRWQGRRVPPLRRFAAGYAAVILVGAAVVAAIGPTAVFYWLHEQVFPPDHQWFFWYRDSLMSTLMQAPDLFGAIAAAWLAFTLALGWALLSLGVKSFLSTTSRTGRSDPE